MKSQNRRRRLKAGAHLATTKAELLRSYNEVVQVYSDLVSKLNWNRRPRLSARYADLLVIKHRDPLVMEWRVRAETERKRWTSTSRRTDACRKAQTPSSCMVKTIRSAVLDIILACYLEAYGHAALTPTGTV